MRRWCSSNWKIGKLRRKYTFQFPMIILNFFSPTLSSNRQLDNLTGKCITDIVYSWKGKNMKLLINNKIEEMYLIISDKMEEKYLIISDKVEEKYLISRREHTLTYRWMIGLHSYSISPVALSFSSYIYQLIKHKKDFCFLKIIHLKHTSCKK